MHAERDYEEVGPNSQSLYQVKKVAAIKGKLTSVNKEIRNLGDLVKLLQADGRKKDARIAGFVELASPAARKARTGQAAIAADEDAAGLATVDEWFDDAAGNERTPVTGVQMNGMIAIVARAWNKSEAQARLIIKQVEEARCLVVARKSINDAMDAVMAEA
jgi:hypothetical protein